MSRPKVAVVKAEEIQGNAEFMGGGFVRYDQDVAAIRAAVKQAVELSIGSLDSIIKPGDRVLIKPNLAFRPQQKALLWWIHERWRLWWLM